MVGTPPLPRTDLDPNSPPAARTPEIVAQAPVKSPARRRRLVAANKLCRATDGKPWRAHPARPRGRETPARNAERQIDIADANGTRPEAQWDWADRPAAAGAGADCRREGEEWPKAELACRGGGGRQTAHRNGRSRRCGQGTSPPLGWRYASPPPDRG